jgi:SET domain-containing protein
MKSKQSKSTVPAHHAHARSPNSAAHHDSCIEVRDSPIHGKGVYATRNIKKGERVTEYLGERITHAEADRRYNLKDQDDGHTFLFIASNRTVIDGSVGGNDARYINHRCEPNCESVIDGKQVFVEAIRDIKKGDELGYDYQLTWESDDDPDDLANYACLCGSKKCRGTMLDKTPLDVLRKRAKARRAKAKAKAKSKSKSKSKTAVKAKTKSVRRKK